MGLDSCVLFQSRSKFLIANGERWGLPKDNLVQLCRLISFKQCGILSTIPAREGFGDRILGRCSGFSRGLLWLGSGFLECKRRTRESCLIPHQSHGFTISAMSKSRDSDNGAQIPCTEAATSSKYPCMYVKSAVSSGVTIQYPGTVVVRTFTSTLAVFSSLGHRCWQSSLRRLSGVPSPGSRQNNSLSRC